MTIPTEITDDVEVYLPEYDTYDSLHCVASVNPGCAPMRGEPGEPPFVERIQLDVSGDGDLEDLETWSTQVQLEVRAAMEEVLALAMIG